MFTAVHFQNFKVLRKTTLPLGRFTLIVGPNGSGKTTALQAFEALREPSNFVFQRLLTIGADVKQSQVVSLRFDWTSSEQDARVQLQWTRGTGASPSYTGVSEAIQAVGAARERIRNYALDAVLLAHPVELLPRRELDRRGGGLAGVLDRLRDDAPERFEMLNQQLTRWVPEFDRVLFDTPEPGKRAILLRTRSGHYPIPAGELSQGTLLALTMLTLAYVPEPPPLIGLEEPDRGIHPRLLRDVRDALYRLSYPEDFDEARAPVQVIATTHSPYMIDLYRDHPDEVVVAQKAGHEASFERLSDQPNINEILGDTPLGEAWYSGILGGVPVES